LTSGNAPAAGPWPEALRQALAAHDRAVLVTVADARGSTPRESGAAMVVTPSGLLGTIGGGHLEYEALRMAREALADDASPAAAWLVRFPLAARLGQCCGGVVTLAFEVVARADAAWLGIACACARTGAPFAVVARIGSGPEAATRLVVTRDDARGSLGAAALDSAAIAVARDHLDAAASGSAAVGAGGAELCLHVVRPSAFDVLVFGNGHVGRALVQVLGALPARVRWIDQREHDFPAQVPANVEVVPTDAPDAELRTAAAGSYVVILTHSHTLDFELAAAALARDDWRYLGVIGSQAKRAQLERKLAARGVGAEALDRVTCPIGTTIARLRSKEPGAIAVAIAAELLAMREQTAAQPRPLVATGHGSA
jgi:xanthine dehydrogenase accessory factor